MTRERREFAERNQAKLFIAGREHFATGNRQRAMARIAAGTFDAVIVSHRSFEFLPVSDKLFRRFVEEQVEEQDDPVAAAWLIRSRQSSMSHMRQRARTLGTSAFSEQHFARVIRGAAEDSGCSPSRDLRARRRVTVVRDAGHRSEEILR